MELEQEQQRLSERPFEEWARTFATKALGSMLSEAASAGDAPRCQELLRLGARSDWPGEDGWSALQKTAIADDLELFLMLRGFGDVDAGGFWKEPPSKLAHEAGGRIRSWLEAEKISQNEENLFEAELPKNAIESSEARRL